MSSSEFISKIDYYCHKKESLFDQSKFKYAIRSMFAGAFLTFSTAAGAIGADIYSIASFQVLVISYFPLYLLGDLPISFS